MGITLYGLGPSRSFRCLWALEECELEYDYVNLDLASSEPDGAKSHQYLTLNAQGKVPTLVHDDFVLTESAAILNYLNSISSSGFVPTDDTRKRALYDELAFFILTELEQPLWTTGKHRFAIPEEQRVEAVLSTAKWEFEKAVNALKSIVPFTSQSSYKGEYALGETFSFADILLAQTINWADRFNFELANSMLSYRDAMYARPASSRALNRID